MSDRHGATPDDDALLARLRTVAGIVDDVPAQVVEAARAAFILSDLDAELAQLVSDSVEGEEPIPVRGYVQANRRRFLSFATEAGSIDVEVEPRDDDRRLVGLVGFAASHVTVEFRHGRHSAPIDNLGRFAVTVPAGLARLRFLGQRQVVTSWTLL